MDEDHGSVNDIDVRRSQERKTFLVRRDGCMNVWQAVMNKGHVVCSYSRAHYPAIVSNIKDRILFVFPNTLGAPQSARNVSGRAFHPDAANAGDRERAEHLPL